MPFLQNNLFAHFTFTQFTKFVGSDRFPTKQKLRMNFTQLLKEAAELQWSTRRRRRDMLPDARVAHPA
jgi:hypothetical protein